MRIFVPPLEIGDEEGFTPEKDLFGRKDFGDGLTRLIINVDDPLVIALDGQWGSGKTTFLKMWAGELRKQGFPVVFFDAFANDYMSDAFMALAGQIVALADKKNKLDGEKTKEFVNKAISVSKILLRGSLKVGIKAATLGALDGDVLGGVAKEVAKDIAKEAGDLEDKYIGELLTKQAQEKDLIESFKAALELLSDGLVDEALAAENETNAQKMRLVIIIDELDRCRPDFALSLLERIKHFFSVQGVFFVLSVNYSQLESSVSAVYGNSINAHNYLQKFVHFIFPIDSEQGIFASPENKKKFLVKRFNDHGFPANDFTVYFMNLLAVLAEKEMLSLRDVDRIASNMALLIGFGAPNHFDEEVAISLIILRTKNRSLYLKAKNGELTYEELHAEFSTLSLGLSQDEIKYETRFRALWKYLLDGIDSSPHNFSRKLPPKERKNFSGGARGNSSSEPAAQ